MAFLYSALGRDKRISDIVFAGSHDASIVSGGSNAMTQSLDIKGQALAGVRLFDLRIAAKGNGDGASLKGYHGSLGGKNKVTLTSSHTGNLESSSPTAGFSAPLATSFRRCWRRAGTSSRARASS